VRLLAELLGMLHISLIIMLIILSNFLIFGLENGTTLYAYAHTKVETPYHDNDLILTPIISPQSG
jgi:hypothetical protein